MPSIPQRTEDDRAIFPWGSGALLLYPLIAALWIGKKVYPDLGLISRGQVFFMAAVLWVSGTLVMNAAL
jgi:hypothetical protein